MFNRLFFGALFLVCAGVVFAQAYKWVDADGVVHYSDRPAPGAEEIQLPSSGRSYGRRVRPRIITSTNSSDDDSGNAAYQSFAVASPAAEETLWNIAGVLNVTLNLQPGLKPGHRVQVYFDGTPQAVGGLSFSLPEVHRGVHNLQAEILDAAGNLMIRTQTNRFYVQQSVIARN